MGFKRRLFVSDKHYWHLSRKKLKRMDALFDLVQQGHNVSGTSLPDDAGGMGQYASFEERREKAK